MLTQQLKDGTLAIWGIAVIRWCQVEEKVAFQSSFFSLIRIGLAAGHRKYLPFCFSILLANSVNYGLLF